MARCFAARCVDNGADLRRIQRQSRASAESVSFRPLLLGETPAVNPALADLQNPSRKDVLAFVDRIHHHLRYSLGRKREEAKAEDIFRALSLAARHDLIDHAIDTVERYDRRDPKRVYYLSIEFLMGRLLRDNLGNLGIYEISRQAVAEFGMDIDEIIEIEPDAGLGNGGLGRLAACFLDSLATLGIPAYGYGIHYEYGLFKQEFAGGEQKERPDSWLTKGTPWEVERQNRMCFVPVYGRVLGDVDLQGEYNPVWMDWKLIASIPQDIAVVGYGGKTCNTLRLFAARGSDEFDMSIFNSGDYIKAVQEKIEAETITKVLYPSDAVVAGRELRLLQEYFLVYSAIRDILHRFERLHTDYAELPQRAAIQLNDTHPALAVAELMRNLVDQHSVPWEKAWSITQAVFGYTNHTLLPEALEKWPVPLLEQVLPRHTQIIYEINRRFLDEVSSRYPGDAGKLQRMSLLEENEPKMVRMAHLAIVGSHSINGVSALHSELVRTRLVPDFAAMWPARFNSKTNGVTQRRWLLYANPQLAALITRSIGDGWICDLDQLRGLEPLAEDPVFQQEFLSVKRENKQRLAALIDDTLQITVSPDSLFDVHVKRIHEYKRQLLNALHIIHVYLSLVEDGRAPDVPRTYVFAGKAAPGYFMAKRIIRLINGIARAVNGDPRTVGHLRVVFLPDYRVSLAEKIIPAADVSEQISTGGTEASGTGNMKLAMNGAVTLGTLDGANIEIAEEVGRENIYIFGLTAAQIEEMRRNGSYHPREVCEGNPSLRRVVEAMAGSRFCPGEQGIYQPICDALLGGDRYFHFADFDSYAAAQTQAARDFTDRSGWARKAILNVARTGKFSSDRTIREYAKEIWGVAPVLD
jgi:starch phosphorylase